MPVALSDEQPEPVHPSPIAAGSSMLAQVQQVADSKLPRNVSFIQGCEESTAYREHNPPAVLRKVGSISEVPDKELGAKKLVRSLTKSDEIHILLAVTGSVATIKLPLIVRKLKQIYRNKAVIQLMVTRASTVFLDTKEIPKDVKIWRDEDEWESRMGKPDNSLHVELRRWADILVVAPCSANTLAKFAYGICDNLITSVFRVWNPALPVLLSPAMNTLMYTNPVTKRHLAVMKDFYPYVEILKPVEKVLVCGDIGMGGMREWTDIVQIIVARLGTTEDEDLEPEVTN